MTVPRYENGRLMAAGESWAMRNAEVLPEHGGTKNSNSAGAVLMAETKRLQRPCAKCGKRFQPTRQRLMLCRGCFTSPSNGGMAA